MSISNGKRGFNVNFCPRPARYPDEWFRYYWQAETELQFINGLLRAYPGANIDRSSLKESRKGRNVSDANDKPLVVRH